MIFQGENHKSLKLPFLSDFWGFRQKNQGEYYAYR